MPQEDAVAETVKPAVAEVVPEKMPVSEKEAEVKKPSKKSKKNKNKKNQQLTTAKNETPSAPVQEKESAPVSAPAEKPANEKPNGPQQQQQQTQPAQSKKSKKNEKKESAKDNRCCAPGKISLVDEIARARQQIKNSLIVDAPMPECYGDFEINSRVVRLEKENYYFKNMMEEMKTCIASVSSLMTRVEKLEKNCKVSVLASKSNDDVDLFESDDDCQADPEHEKIRAERLKKYAEKKAKKPTLVAKSNIILDIKPWDDETDMKKMEVKVREVALDGLLWGASKLVPLAYGIHKLQISCVIEDEKVSVDDLQEKIEANGDLVQSVDIAAFNKV